MTAPAGRTLARVLTAPDLTAFTINSIIGAGIFGIPAILAARVGAFSWVAMLIAAAVVALIALCFAEMGSAFGGTGGPYLYARHVFGPAAGFQVGWLMWIARLTGFASVTNLFVNYLGYFVPGASGGIVRAGIIVALTVAFTIINLIGVRQAATVANLLTIAKLVPLTLFVVVGLAFINGSRLLPATPVRAVPLLGAVMLAVYAFSGF